MKLPFSKDLMNTEEKRAVSFARTMEAVRHQLDDILLAVENNKLDDIVRQQVLISIFDSNQLMHERLIKFRKAELARQGEILTINK